jgi:hypothetical protein
MSIASGGYDVGNNTRATAVVENDVPTVWLTTAATGTGAPKEGDNQKLKFTAHRDNAHGPLKIWYYANSFDLVEGQDYDFPADSLDADRPWLHSLEFADGEGTKDIEFTVIDDPDVEPTQTLTVTIDNAPSDLLAGDGKYLTLGGGEQPNFAEGSIQDNDVNVTIEGPVLTAGLTETYTVWARDYDGIPVSGKPITIGGFDSDQIHPATTQITSSGGGAPLEIQGLSTGTDDANLILADVGLQPQGQQQQAGQIQLGNPRIAQPIDALTVIGGTVDWTAIIVDAQGRAPAGQPVAVTLPNQNVATISESDNAANAQGAVHVKFRGVALNNNSNNAPITVTLNGAKVVGNVGVLVKHATVTQITNPMVAGAGKHFRVQVANSRGTPVRGYDIKLTGDAKFNVTGPFGGANEQTSTSGPDGIADFIGQATAGNASLKFIAVDDNQVNNTNAPWNLQINPA